MKEIPMLFSTPMVQAELDGRKTMTRRTKKLEVINENPSDWQFEWAEPMRNVWTFTQKSTVNEQSLQGRSLTQFQTKCPYGVPGDLLWVRETYRIEGSMSHGESVLGVKYKAGGRWIQNDSKEVFEIFHKSKEGWHPNIFLPKTAARIWLQVESVRVERLQDISEADAIAEGIEQVGICPSDIQPEYKDYCGELKRIGETKEWGLSPIGSFQSLWVKINGTESWQANPWVWVISFKVLSTTGKPVEKSE